MKGIQAYTSGIQAYTHKDFFKEIDNLETKTLLDVGAGEGCAYSMAYLS